VIPALAGRSEDRAAEGYTYFIDMVKRLHEVQPGQLTDNSVLLGNTQAITDSLKKVEGGGLLRGDPSTSMSA